MKLPALSQDRQVWLREFDLWITPFLEEIRDSLIFHHTIKHIKTAFDLLGANNNQFSDEISVSPESLANSIIAAIDNPEKAFESVSACCDLLFLITGKTDNNSKCQFPAYLRSLGQTKYPAIRHKKIIEVDLPRVLTNESVAKMVSQLEAIYQSTIQEKEGNLDKLSVSVHSKQLQRVILTNYFKFIINQPIYSKSLQFYGRQYFSLKAQGLEDSILSPMVIAYVRGSASATGGHKPETLLKEHMNSWGMRPNEDYNTNDVNPYEALSDDGSKKRAFDFVLPYNLEGWGYKIFIQSQFYAGDSGSVSHKNVDQTSNSRKAVSQKYENPLFVEYVDGAGYFSSLNGDLKRLLSMDDTYNFIQVRSFPIKLRQIFQQIGYLIPLELYHSVIISGGSMEKASALLIADGYSDSEVKRTINKTLKEGLIIISNEKAEASPVFHELSRRYFLLDLFAVYGHPINNNNKEQDLYLIPGYQEEYGGKLSHLLSHAKTIAGSYFDDWSNPIVLGEDIEFLLRNKWIIPLVNNS